MTIYDQRVYLQNFQPQHGFWPSSISLINNQPWIFIFKIDVQFYLIFSSLLQFVQSDQLKVITFNFTNKMILPFLLLFVSLACSQLCQQYQVAFGNTCLNQCPQNSVLSIKNRVPTCEECDITSFQVLSQDKTKCVCARQTYLNEKRNQCLPCHYTCLTCSGPSNKQCKTCDSSPQTTFRVMQKQLCVCKEGYFDDGVSSSLKCFTCHQDCRTCNGPEDTDCLECVRSKIKDEFGLCVCQNGFIDNDRGNCICPAPFIIMSDGSCKNASSQCGYNEQADKAVINIAQAAKKDAKKSNCSCRQGYYRIKGKCTTCSQNQVYNSKKQKCECNSNAVKIKNKCIVCPPDQKYNKKTSQCACKKNFQKTQLGTCVKCPNKSVYANGTCNCIFNHFMDQSGKCKKCNKRNDNPLCIQAVDTVDRPRKLQRSQILIKINDTQFILA